MIFKVQDKWVLIANQAERGEQPSASRFWETAFGQSVFGNESRLAMRDVPLRSLDWTVMTFSEQDQQHLEDVVRESLRTGHACAPLWGRGSLLTADLTGTVVSTDGAWVFRPGEWAYVTDGESFEVRQIASVGPVTLSAAVDRTWLSGLMIWPLLFGKPSFRSMTGRNGCIGRISVSIRELVSELSAQVGASPAGGEGIGFWALGTEFEIQ